MLNARWHATASEVRTIISDASEKEEADDDDDETRRTMPGVEELGEKHRRRTTLSSRVVWLPNACLMSSFLIIFSSLVTLAILRSQLINAVRIHFSQLVN